MARENEIIAMYLGGIAQHEIAKCYGITRQRIQQILKRRGISRADGGIARNFLAKKEDALRMKKEASDRRSLAVYGATSDQVFALNGGRRLSAPGSLAGCYKQQIKNAKARGIEWSMTFPEWVKIWKDSGMIEVRGLGTGGAVMCRFGDVGPYIVGNVYIASSGQNISDCWAFRRKATNRLEGASRKL